MNKEGKINSGKSVSPVKLLTGIIVGGVAAVALWRSIKKVNRGVILDKGIIEKVEDNINTINSVNDNVVKSYIGDEFIGDLIDKINEDPIFGPEDIYINKEENEEFDDVHENYILVEYIKKEYDEDDDDHVSVTLKLNDVVSKERRLIKDFFEKDSTMNELRGMADELRSSKSYYNMIKYKSVPLSFYFDTKDGRHGENLKYKELRDLDFISGFRYIKFKFFRCESRDGVEFIKEFVKLFHYNGGEEDKDSKYNIMPLVINYESGDIIQFSDNNVLRDYLK